MSIGEVAASFGGRIVPHKRARASTIDDIERAVPVDMVLKVDVVVDTAVAVSLGVKQGGYDIVDLVEVAFTIDGGCIGRGKAGGDFRGIRADLLPSGGPSV